MTSCPACGHPVAESDARCPDCGLALQSSAERLPFPIREEPLDPDRPVVRRWRAIKTTMQWCGLIAALMALTALFLPAGGSRRNVSPRSICRNNLKQLGIALHTYHDHYGCFPPAYVVDESGRRLHSWRVLLLPYIGEESLYAKYDFSKRWDSPENQAVLLARPDVYACPSHKGKPKTDTSYCVASGRGTFFPGAESRRISDHKDGLMQIVILGEVTDAAIPWTSPYDIDLDAGSARLGDPREFSSKHAKGAVQVLFGDGSVGTLSPETVTPEMLRQLAGIDDGTPEETSWRGW